MKTKKNRKQQRRSKPALPLEPNMYELPRILATLGAVLPEGTVCKVYGSDRIVTIKYAYGWQRVSTDAKEAEWIGADADREPICLRPGYIVTNKSGEDVFAPAGNLVRIDAPKNYSHLKVVK